MSLKFFNTWLYREIAENHTNFSRKINLLFLGLGIAFPSFILFYFWPVNNLPANSASTPIISENTEPIKPIPISIELDYQKVELGEKLFFDKQLSKNNTVSCGSCHRLEMGGTDRSKYSVLFNNALSSVNSPTIFNVGFNFKQFWNGKSETLEEQAAVTINNSKSMGSNWEEVISKLSKDQDYISKFKLIYKSEIKPEYIINAIAEYERSLFTPNSRFDQYLRGDTNAIDQDELEGYTLFKKYGCTSCHQGVNIGGNMFETFGVSGDYFSMRGNITEADYGRYTVTKNEADKFVFKVPSLRNVSLTAPYLHDGSAETLEEAVRIMSIYQLGRTLNNDESTKIIKFLKTLTGELKGKKLE
jgi:cytochrome c peroxidase